MKENGRWQTHRKMRLFVVPCALILVLKRKAMNQMLQDPQVQTSKAETSQAQPPVPVTEHPRFAKPQRVAFVQACWHRDVVEEARIAFIKEAEARHLTHVDVFEVPGSFEIPLHAQVLAKTRRYTAIVAAGLVVDGGI